MNPTIFPTEALLLGLCVGEFSARGQPSEFLTSKAAMLVRVLGDGEDSRRCASYLQRPVQQRPFLHILRNRLLPIIPSYVADSAKSNNQRPAYDFSRSLFDVIVDDLRGSVAKSKLEEKIGFSEDLENKEHQWMQLLDFCESHSENADLEDFKTSIINMALSRIGTDDKATIEGYFSSLANNSGFKQLFELGRLFGIVVPAFEQAYDWLYSGMVNPYPGQFGDEDFRLSDFLNLEQVDEIVNRLTAYVAAQSLVLRVRRCCELEFRPTTKRFADLFFVQDMSANIWQAFGLVLGAVREEDEIARRDEKSRSIPRELLLGGRITDDRIAEAIRNAQELVRAQRGTPAVAVSQLANMVEACIKRVLKKELTYPNSTILGALEKHRRSRDERMAKFVHIALVLREVYRHDATHEFEELEVSWAEATFFVTGVQVLFELTKTIGA